MAKIAVVESQGPDNYLLHFRATPELYALVRASAQQNKRSVSAEIAFMLEAAYAAKEQVKA